MIVLYRLIAASIVIFSAAIVLGRHVAESEPTPPVVMLFSNPDGSPCQRPCLLGMTPGVTRFEDAYVMIRDHPLSRNSILRQSLSSGTSFAFTDPLIQVAITKDEAGTLSQSDLTLNGATLGELVGIIGLPTWVNAGGSTVYLYYPLRGLILRITKLQGGLPSVLDIDDPIESITIVPTSYETFGKLPDFAEPWRGFAALARYSQ